MTDDFPLPENIDELMALDPLELSKTPKTYEKYIAGVIAYHRNARAAKEQGEKTPKRGKGKAAVGSAGTEASLKLADLVKAAKPKPVISVGQTPGGLRRI